MTKQKIAESREELRRMALPQVRNWPGCDAVEDISIDLDEDGDWTIAAKATAPHDPVAVYRATSAVRNELRKQYTLAT